MIETEKSKIEHKRITRIIGSVVIDEYSYYSVTEIYRNEDIYILTLTMDGFSGRIKYNYNFSFYYIGQ